MVRKVYLESNKKYGRLTLIKPLPYSDHCGYSLSLCQCDCGKEVEVATSRVLHGITRSCGCLRSDIAKKYNLAKWKKVIPGLKYGRLLVQDVAGKTEDEELAYRCECDCGNEIVVLGKKLMNKSTSSCGCVKEKINQQKSRRNKSIWPGTIFYQLKVIAPECRNNSGETIYKCTCQCGNKISVLSSMLRDGAIRDCGCLSRASDDHVTININNLTL